MTGQDDLMMTQPADELAPEMESQPEIEVEFVIEEGGRWNRRPVGLLMLFQQELIEPEVEPEIFEIEVTVERPRVPIWLLFLGLIFGSLLLIGGTIGGARAALSIQSDVYSAEVELLDIGITLTENGEPVSRRNYTAADSGYIWDEQIGSLLSGMLEQTDSTLKLGYSYDEAFGVTNSGRIDEYVRVIVYRYWTEVDESGRTTDKKTSVDPSLIRLDWDNLGEDWIIDEASSTAERVILYYNRILPVGESTPAFTSKLTIDEQIPYKVTVSESGDMITTVHDYAGATFQIEIETDGVQTHNGRDAIQSSWGLTDGELARLEAAGLRIEEG